MTTRTTMRTTMSGIALGMLLFCIGAAAAHAQRFQYEYGGADREGGRGGVHAASDGGFIAIGETFTPSGGPTSDIYLVRTNNDGSLAWSRTYAIAGNDSATDIEELPGGDGYIVTGVTDNNDPNACRRNRDLFLLRLDRCGRVLWVDTYGTDVTDEIGYDVEVMDNEDACGGAIGDFVVVGSTCEPNRPRDGYMIRVHDQAPANLVWTRTHNGPCDRDDYWYGVAEVIVAADGGRPGDLVVVGGSDGYCTGAGGYEGVIAHFDGCGTIPGGAPYGVALYGGRDNDELRSVIEMQDGAYRGTFIATGRSEIRQPSGAFSSEVYVVQTRAWPCRRVDDATLGDRGSRPDESFWIREVRAPHPDAGMVVITGYMTLAGGFGGRDLFVQRILPTAGGLVWINPTTQLYGGFGEDEGWSVEPVVGNATNCYSDGYIVAGLNVSFSGTQQLYLIKTDAVMISGCNERAVIAGEGHPNYEEYCVEPKIDARGTECRPRGEIDCPTWETRLCFDPDGTVFCAAIGCSCPNPFFKSAPMEGAPEFDASGTLGAYPNPVRRGSAFTLECSIAEDATATVVVSDLAGKVVHSQSRGFTAGSHHLSIATDGWSAGTYVVQLTIGEKVLRGRIVVGDK